MCVLRKHVGQRPSTSPPRECRVLEMCLWPLAKTNGRGHFPRAALRSALGYVVFGLWPKEVRREDVHDAKSRLLLHADRHEGFVIFREIDRTRLGRSLALPFEIGRIRLGGSLALPMSVLPVREAVEPCGAPGRNLYSGANLGRGGTRFSGRRRRSPVNRRRPWCVAGGTSRCAKPLRLSILGDARAAPPLRGASPAHPPLFACRA